MPNAQGLITVAEFNELKAQINNAHGALRRENKGFAERATEQLGNLAALAKHLDASRSAPDFIAWERNGVVRIEDIPGRRVPFDFTVDIPIATGSTTTVEASFTVSQEGPFVAVTRYATFQSLLSYQVTVGTTRSRFNGRTYGRYRPIHSAWDLHDAQQPNGYSAVNPYAGANNAVPYVVSAASGGRSMSFDGRILVVNSGSSFPRQNDNNGVPSAFWTTQINSPQELGALDFFERGEVVSFKVTPSHVNNPSFGNASGEYLAAPAATVLGAVGWPFLEGQFDPHEGIVAPFAISGTSPTVRIATDSIQRVPDGILTIGMMGYRIIQPVGPVP